MQKLLLVLTALGATSCTDRPAPDAGPPEAAVPDIARTTFAPSLGVDLAVMTQTPRGAWIRDLTVGTGEPVTVGKEVAIHYAGSLPDGKQFDANGPADAPFVFRLGAGDVVPGFDEGVTGMRVGGKRQVVIPPALGYGAQANGPIPANAILVFTIDLVSAR
jgi:FKBP-type peptidyl-prolyl cis-trans isomerase